MRRRRRRELFPPDVRLQVRMLVASVVTPLVVLAALAAVVWLLPTRLAVGVGIATAIGVAIAFNSAAEETGRRLTPEEAPEVHADVHRLCALGDIPLPSLVVHDERQPNSWIVDAPRRAPELHLTRGLLDALEGAELEAVIAHELAHVANRDATVMTVVGGPSLALTEGGARMTRGGWWPMQIGALLALAIGQLSSIGTRALSRYRELSADRGAAALTGRPAALASALLKVSGELSRIPARDLRVAAGRNAFNLLPVEAHGGGRGRGRGRGHHRAGRGPLAPLFRLGQRWPFTVLGATHPPLERRLAELERLEQRMHAARPHPQL